MNDNVYADQGDGVQRSPGRLRGMPIQTRLIILAWVVLLVVSLALIGLTINAVGQFESRVDAAQLSRGGTSLPAETRALQTQLLVQYAAGAVLAGLMMTIFTGWIVRRLVTRPLSALNAAVEVLGADNLEVPWPSVRGGEVGRLIANLEQVGQSLATLQERVEERTAELVQVNERLAQEIVERERAQERLESAQEAAWAAERAKRAFVNRMSHELRTPLNAIIGYSELLQEQAEELYNALTLDLNRIRQSGTQLLTQINEVLNLSQLESGEVETRLETFALQPLLDEVVGVVRPILQKNENTLAVQRADDVVTLCSDRAQVRQILVNLMENAAKFTRGGQIDLSVERDSGEPDDWVVFRVADTGIGIAPYKVDELFEPFAQADSSTTRPYDGTGLGLTLVKRFCDILGGSVTVQSEQGEGSVFTVRLPDRVGMDEVAYLDLPPEPEAPLAEEAVERVPLPEVGEVPPAADDATPPTQPEAPSAKREVEHPVQLGPRIDGDLLDALAKLEVPEEDRGEERPSGAAPRDKDELLGLLADLDLPEAPPEPEAPPAGRSVEATPRAERTSRAGGIVLVIDDDPTAREGITRCLTQSGFDTMTAASGEEGLLWTRMRRPDFVTLNVLMAEMDGWAALKAFKSDPELAGIPVFMLAIGEDRETGWVLGVAEYLADTADCHRLALMVSQYLPGLGSQRTGRALLVEGKPDLRELLQSLLERDGWQVLGAEDEQDASAILEEQRLEVIVLDLMVPELDHLRFLAKLRRDPTWRSVPIVFFTAKDFTPGSRQRYNEYVAQALQERAAEFKDFLGQVCESVIAHTRG